MIIFDQKRQNLTQRSRSYLKEVFDYFRAKSALWAPEKLVWENFGVIRLGFRRAGYTIIETLIFLAVTGGLFIIAATFMSGRQEKVQFDQSVRDLDSKIQDIINDTSTGYFPQTDITCAVSGGAINITPAAGGVQGSNRDCIFVGKTIQFGIQNGGCGGANREGCSTLEIYTLVGKAKQAGTNDPVISIDQAAPVSTDSLAEIYEIKWQTYIDKVFERPASGPTVDIGQAGFVSNLSPITATQQISSQSLRAVKVNASAIGHDRGTAISKIPITATDGIRLTDRPMVVCLSNGAGRKASITLNADQSVNNTVIDFDAAATAEGC